MDKFIAILCSIFVGINANIFATTTSNTLLDDIDVFNKMFSGISYKVVHLLFGEPEPGGPSGIRADVYFNSDEQAVIIYYDENGKVDFAVLGGWSKPNKENEYTEIYDISDEPPFWLMDNS